MSLPDVSCYDCGATYPAGRKRCDCGEPVWFETDPAAARPDEARSGVARYADWLPAAPESGLGTASGDTPAFRAARLDEYAGCRVTVKDETENPTGTFKDRGSSVAVAALTGTAATGLGDDESDEATAEADAPPRIGTVSHGNMAMSTAAHAAAAGVGCTVLVPADVSAERLAAIAQYGPEVLRVEGDYGRLYRETLALDVGVEFVNSDTPLRVAGQATTALELCERDPPDAVVVPTSSGGHASGVWRALRDLRAVGYVDDVPRILLAQAAACDPIARAYREGTDVRPVDPKPTAAYSIANPDPPSGDRALAAVRDTGGAVVSVDEDAIAEATRRLARDAGLCVEPSSAVALAGLRELAAAGEVDRDEDAAVVATGTGFKELGGGDVDAPVVALDDVPARLGA